MGPHPFESLATLVWELVHQHRLDVGDTGVLDLADPRVHDPVDAYLGVWQDHADLRTLRQLAAAALQIAPLYRAERRLHVLAHRPDALGPRGDTPRAWVFDVERMVLL